MPHDSDITVLRLAAGQHGALSQGDLLAAGVSRSTIVRRVRSGLLRPVAKGRYVVAPLESANSILAAALLGPERAAASHRSAARLHGMELPAGPEPEIVVTKGQIQSRGPVRIHETRSLPEVDLTRIDGLVVTTAARTLCDLAAVIDERQLRRLVQRQLVKRRPSAGEIVACHQSLTRRGRTGTVLMRRVLATEITGEPITSSELERRFAVALAEHNIRGLVRQFAPPWYDGIVGIVDFADPEGRTIIEADGRAFHTIDQDRRRDQARDRMAARNGWLVLRVGWYEVVHRTAALMAEVDEIVTLRRSDATRPDPPSA